MMKRALTASLVTCFCALALTVTMAFAEDEPRFQLGFKALADQIPDIVGQPIENEHWEANGDSLQMTSNGMMVWRKADNWTAFTNGHTTWINGPEGVQSRLNSARFGWEKDDPSTPSGSQPPAPAEPAPKLPGPDWTQADRSADGFKISVPPTWKHVDPSSDDLIGEFKSIVKDRPDAATLAQTYSLTAGFIELTGGVFFAVPTNPDLVGRPGSALVKILKVELPEAMTMDDLVAMVVDSFNDKATQQVIGNVANRRVSLPAGEAEEFAYVEKVKIGNFPETAAGVVEYLLIRDGVLYDVVFLATDPAGANELMQITEPMIHSFEFTAPPGAPAVSPVGNA